MTPQKVLRLVFIILWILSTLLMPSGAAFPADSVEGLAQPYFFNLPGWEVINVWDLLRNHVTHSAGNTQLVEQPDLDFVKEYFRMGQEIRSLQTRIRQFSASNPGETRQIDQLEDQVETVKRGMEAKETKVKAIISRQIGKVLSTEGILPLPPISFAFDTPPQILVISPRERIALEKPLLLKPGLSLEQATKLEQQIESLATSPVRVWGVSALVEELGGLALYPSLIPETSTIDHALPTVAHEWVHQYLFFHPLGQKYGTSNNMTTINETVADIVGDEVGEWVLKDYGIRLEKEPRKKASGFDFNLEMRQTRFRVDELLAKGQVKEAEEYMEERRQFFAKEGYYLRRLNQAYFAFHGSYADTPASTSPVAGWLRTIRGKSSSLGDFLRTVARISSYEELESLAVR
mgnify:CR=1 FL=1